MGRALMGMMTAGAWFLFTKPPSSGLERRLGKGGIKFETFNVPSRERALKVLRTYLCEAEAERVLSLIERRSKFYVRDQEAFEAIAESFKKAGFPVLDDEYVPHAHPDYGYFYHPQVVDLETGELSDLRRFNQCFTPGCSGDGTMVRDFGNVPICHYCGSNNVIDAANLSDQEFDKHVKKLERSKPRGKDKATTVGDILNERLQGSDPTAEDILKVRAGDIRF